MISTDKIVTRYEADASDFLRAMDSIKKSQEVMQSDLSKVAKVGENSSKNLIASFARIVGPVASAVGAITLLKKGFNDLAQYSKLAASAGVVDLNALREASAGLLTETQLLTIASAANRGQIKLNSEQKIAAVGAIRALIREGNEEREVIQKVTQALIKGKLEGLDDFGFAAESTGSKVGDFNSLMAQLSARAAGVKGSALTAEESIQSLGVKTEDAFDRISRAFGRLVRAIEPLIDATATVIDNIANFIGGDGGSFDLNAFEDQFFNKSPDRFLRKQNASSSSSSSSNGYENLGINYAESAKQDAFDVEVVKHQLQTKEFKKTIKAFSSVLNSVGKVGQAIPNINRPKQKEAYEEAYEEEYTLGTAHDQAAEDRIQFFAKIEELQKRATALEGASTQSGGDGELILQKGKEGGFLERLLGPLETFDEYGAKLELVQNAISGFTDVAGAGLAAFIDGGDIAAAMKKQIFEVMKANAIDMLGKSIYHGAAALGFLATGNYAAASLNGAAAVKYAAGAVALGVLAKTIGGGGAGSPQAGAASSGGRTGFGAPSGTSGTSGPTGGTIVIGDSFADDSPRMRQRKAAKALQLVYGSGQGARFN